VICSTNDGARVTEIEAMTDSTRTDVLWELATKQSSHHRSNMPMMEYLTDGDGVDLALDYDRTVLAGINVDALIHLSIFNNQ
jgi:hypothetical protein